MIRTVGVFSKPTDIPKLATISIRIGNDPNPRNNPVCQGSIITDGIYTCTSPLTGNFIGFERTG